MDTAPIFFFFCGQEACCLSLSSGRPYKIDTAPTHKLFGNITQKYEKLLLPSFPNPEKRKDDFYTHLVALPCSTHRSLVVFIMAEEAEEEKMEWRPVVNESPRTERRTTDILQWW